nr:MAG TPA: hypothetical protein [Caudoviricetes sp.]DAH97209.1 MAG TPA: hypothetical protein [Bacteriophage sp.]
MLAVIDFSVHPSYGVTVFLILHNTVPGILLILTLL